MDENPITINDASLAIPALALTGQTYLIDVPGSNHANGAGLAFADGHAITHKWVDARTYYVPLTKHGVVAGGPGHVTPDDPDCFYIAPLTSAPR
jgi:prepilin-type processing-associated H-X9-DG protein